MSKVIAFCFLLTFLCLVSLIASARNNHKDLSCKGKKYNSKSTAYYPADDPTEGGFVDCRDTKLQTLQQFLAGEVNYVSVAMDKKLKIKYGTKLCIPELNKKYNKQIEFRVVDTGPSFTNKGFSRIDICVADEKHSFDESVNGKLTLYFPDLKTGRPYCT